MYLNTLSLINYKNFGSQTFAFDAKINCFVGANGIGKTNVLDAIYHLALGKGYFNPIATQNIKHESDFFVIDGTFIKNGREEKVVCSLKRGTQKVIKRNGKVYERLAEHVGLLPLVIISPSDRDLIVEGSETRRRFIDGVIAQADKIYLEELIKYNQILSQRNALLKYFSLNRTFDETSLMVYNEQLNHFGTSIYQKRLQFMQAFIPIFKQQYASISGERESVSLRYESQLTQDGLLALLKKSTDRDRALQFTTTGVHKDDLILEIAGHPIKKFGSQGQQKSFLIALKFAQFHFMKALDGSPPILLLDDIFDKLDEDRVAYIIGLVDKEAFGQIFISDTHAERTENVVKSIHQSYKIFKL